MNTSGSLAESTVQIHRLDNGMTVVLEPLPYVRSVSAGVWVRVGSGREVEKQAGISHFLEHLFFKGTETRSARELAEPIERHGGQLNGFTSRDYTCLYVRTLDSQLHTGIEILADIMRHSSFYDFEKEKQVVLEEISSISDVPEDYAHDLFMERCWPSHPLGRPVAGSYDSVAGLSVDDVRRYHETWYGPGNMIVAVVGNFDPGELIEQITREFGPLTGTAVDGAEVSPTFTPGIERVERSIAQTHLCFGFPGPCATDARRYVYDLVSCAVGGGATSRLFDRIREQEGLAYSIYSYFSCYDSSGYMAVYAAVAPENLARTVALAFEELRDIRDNGMSAEEVALNREQLQGSLLMALESTFSRMTRLTKSLMYFGRVIPTEEVLAALDAVTPADVHALAESIFRPEQCALLTLGPQNAVIQEIPL